MAINFLKLKYKTMDELVHDLSNNILTPKEALGEIKQMRRNGFDREAMVLERNLERYMGAEKLKKLNA